MTLDIGFFLKSISLGIGLAMDAFSVSLANGLNEPQMKRRKMCAIAGMFAFFQAIMPIIGWICIHTVVNYFQSFEAMIPLIALVLLSYIGGKMLYDGIRNTHNEDSAPCLCFSGLIIQGLATSIDALSVGFTIASYNFTTALISAFIIAVVTFIICIFGIIIGRKAGTKLSGKAGILGGLILIIIGIEIFITGIL